jgi:sec-independent protein translocase protein TatA
VFNIGPTELLVILVIALLVFGPSRLPEVGRTIGKGLREFRKASEEIRQELKIDLDPEPDEPRPTTPSTPYASYSAGQAAGGSPNGAASLDDPDGGEPASPPEADEAR